MAASDRDEEDWDHHFATCGGPPTWRPREKRPTLEARSSPDFSPLNSDRRGENFVPLIEQAVAFAYPPEESESDDRIRARLREVRAGDLFTNIQPSAYEGLSGDSLKAYASGRFSEIVDFVAREYPWMARPGKDD